MAPRTCRRVDRNSHARIRGTPRRRGAGAPLSRSALPAARSDARRVAAEDRCARCTDRRAAGHSRTLRARCDAIQARCIPGGGAGAPGRSVRARAPTGGGAWRRISGAGRYRRGRLSRARCRLHRRRRALLHRDRAVAAMKHLSRRLFLQHLRCSLALAIACAGGATFAQGTQGWPSRPIHIVIPYGAGSSPDVFARLIAEKIAPRLGQAVVVDNRPGAGGNNGTASVAKAAGDGYTFLVSTNGPLVYNTVIYKKLGYDPFTELRPVVLGGAQANVCAVRTDSGITSLGDLVKAMKASPGKFNFASTGVGSLSQLGVELLKAKTDTFAVHIPYASSPLAILALLQGDVQFACVPAIAVMPQVKSGKLRPLAVSTAKRSALMPDIPTMKEAGLPDIENTAWMAVMLSLIHI